MRRSYHPKGLLFLLAGILVLCYGIYLPFQPKTSVAIENISIMESGIITTGEVVSISKTMQKPPGKEDNPDEARKLYEVAAIKYFVDGRSYEVTGERPLQNPGWAKGDSIKIAYVIGDPKKSTVAENGVEGFNSYPYLPVIFILIGTLLNIIGLIIALKK